MKSSTCLIMLMIFGMLAVTIWASNDPPSSAEISDERSFQTSTGEKRSRFHAGSRYGRSQGIDSSDGIDVVPRNNNRFFSGSRYGKRSDEHMQPVFERQSALLFCRFTGMKNFFRCRSLDDDLPLPFAAYGLTEE